jgi:hypothetical protein
MASPINSIPDLNMWLEATLDGSVISASNSNVPENGDLISAWNDINSQDSNKNNATQATSANQPTYVAKGINDLPVLSFDGVNDRFTIGNGIIKEANFTVISVLQRTSSTSGPIIGGISTTGVSVGHSGNDTFIYIFNGNGGNGNDALAFSTPAYSTPIPKIMSFTENSSRTGSFYLNGVVQSPLSSPTMSIPYAYPTTYTVGFSLNLGYFSGQIGEIIVFNRVLKASERASIENYLAKKWGISCCS